MAYTFIQLDRAGPRATITLHRPDLHNAFNAEMIGELRDCLTALANDESARVVVLTGAGRQRARELLAKAAEGLLPTAFVTVSGTVTPTSVTSPEPKRDDEDEEQTDLTELLETQEEEVS